jgi:hypothetical protein
MFSYRRKVRGGAQTFLWGNQSLTGQLLQGGIHVLLLTIQIDEDGEPVRIYRKRLPNTPEEEICLLEAGECITIDVAQVMTVWGICTEPDTYVNCALHTHP